MLKLPAVLILRTRLRFFILTAIACLFCLIAGYYFIRYLVKPFTGLVVTFPEVQSQEEGLIFSPRVSDSPALEAGLRSGRDRIIAIRDIPLHSIRDLVVWESGNTSFEPVPLTVEDESGASRVVTVMPRMSVTQSGWFSILFFIVILGVCAFFILLHYRDEPTYVIFAFISLCYMVYTAVQPFYYENPLTVFFANPGEQTVWLALIFLAFFQKDVVPRRLKNICLVFFCSVIAFFSAARFYQYGRWLATGLDAVYHDVEAVRRLQNICDVPGYVLIIVLLVLVYFKTPHRDLKHHIEWIAAGALLALPAHFFFNQLPQLLEHIQRNPYYMGNPSNFFLAFMPLSFVIGLVRSRGYTLKLFRSRTVVSIAAAFAFLAFFAVLFHPVQRFLTSVLKVEPEIAGFLAGIFLVIAALYFQLIAFLLVDRRLLREERLSAPVFADAFPAAETPASRLSRREKQEGELLMSGLLARFDGFFSQMKKSCRDMRALVIRHADPPSRPRHDASGHSAVAPAEMPFDRIYGSLEKSILAVERLRKRFDVICNNRTSICISLTLDALITSIIPQCERQLKGLTIVYERRPGVKVFCSPEDIAFCLHSALENAWEALAQKNDRVHIRSDVVNEWVTIEIADHGCGVPLKYLHRIGQPFFTTKRGHDGLSLYFTKALLARNNGFFSIEPGLESGTRVIIRLPRSRQTMQTTA